MKNKLLSILGIARKAGCLSLGNESVIESILNRNAKLILFASDLSSNTAKKIISTANENNVEFIYINESIDEIGYAVGKRVGVICINNSGFANKVHTLTAEILKEEHN